MAEKIVLKITVDDDDNLVTEIRDEKLASMAVADSIWQKLMGGDAKALSPLFSATVEVLARDLSGELLEQYVEQLQQYVPVISEQYREKSREISKDIS